MSGGYAGSGDELVLVCTRLYSVLKRLVAHPRSHDRRRLGGRNVSSKPLLGGNVVQGLLAPRRNGTSRGLSIDLITNNYATRLL